MTTISVTGGIPTKHVTIGGLTGAETEDEILALAFVAARESKSSLFGWRVNRGASVATVDLYTD